MVINNYIHSSTIVDDNVIIGNNTKIWHFSHISKNVVIGNDCSLGQNVFVGNNVKIGNGVKIQNNVSIYEGVELEDFVFCGPSMVFTNDPTPRSKFPKGSSHYKKTLIKVGATIGANATIVCGHDIGKWAMVGAGAVVTKNVPDYALVFGNPAVIKGYVCECGERLNETYVCLKCDKVYKKTLDLFERIK
jgi:UDP-2-acetamido-3-amino-2,3-dideoxy-glucuronate N-acetyltransferase